MIFPFQVDVGVNGPLVLHIMSDVLNAYQQHFRHYHNLDHVQECFFEFDSCKRFLKEPEAVQIAIWYHDVDYHIGLTSNEISSSFWAMNDMRTLHFRDEDFRQIVVELIIYTSHERNLYDFLRTADP